MKLHILLIIIDSLSQVHQPNVQLQMCASLPKRDEVIDGWRKLHNADLHNVYSLPSTIRWIKEDAMGRSCSMNEVEEECM